MTSISPTQSNILAAFRAFLSAILPGLPGSPAVFTGSIAGGVLTVAPLPDVNGILGSIQANSPLLGLGVAPGTTIQGQISGQTGGMGTYAVSVSQSVNPTPMSTGVSVVSAQPNRVAEPNNPYFVVMTPLSFDRLETNVDGDADVKIVGSISGAILSVSEFLLGSTIAIGATIFGSGVVPGTQVVGLSGTAGTQFAISPAQTAPSQTMSAGQRNVVQAADHVVQVDFHSPDIGSAGDFVNVVSTLFRDDFAINFFAALTPPLNGVVPLHADAGHQAPFLNAEQQVETRWVMECHFQVDQTVSVPQQYADEATIGLVDVQATYPP